MSELNIIKQIFEIKIFFERHNSSIIKKKKIQILKHTNQIAFHVIKQNPHPHLYKRICLHIFDL